MSGIVPLSVEVGDRVLFGKFAGTDITVDDEELLIVREEEILGVRVIAVHRHG